MNNIASKWLTGLVWLFAGITLAHATDRMPPVLPLPTPAVTRMIIPDAHQPVRLQKVDVKTEVLGTVAHTRIEMTFLNPNLRVLEGELQFPLLDGQTVSGFALDINGELRPAVPVEKARGQQVFEEVIRARIDPALLEKTQGNNYKLRVYPLPAQGTRRVVLELDEVLSANNGKHGYSTYRLPLQFAGAVGQLDVSVHNPAVPEKYSALAVKARLGAEKIKVDYASLKEERSGSRIRFSRKNYTGKGVLEIAFPDSPFPLMVTGTFADESYFYAEVSPPLSKPTPRPAPKQLGLVWDASGSGALRDHGREFALLDAYFKTLADVNVVLVIARDRAEAPQTFAVKKGDWQALRTVLETVAYDGATEASALSPPASTELNLLFSDGLCNYGAGKLAAGNVPFYAVNAAISANLPHLRAAAENTGGQMLDLLSISPDNAVHELTHQSPHLAGMRSNEAKELVSAYSEGGRLKIAGILTEPHATVELDWVDAQGQHQPQQIRIQNDVVASLAAYRWATLQLAQLETDYAANRAAIRRLGTRFGRVTRETSLIVLDRVEDYVRYEIVPPESLRAEYDKQLALQVSKSSDERSKHLDEVAEKFAQRQAWWEKSFPKGKKPLDPESRLKADSDSRFGVGALAVPVTASAMPAPIRMEAGQMVRLAAAPELQAERQSNEVSANSTSSVAIQLKKWQADEPYARRLREALPDDMYRIYLDERASYLNSTAFYLDAADIFLERGQQKLGLRILSNLAEMNLENRHILRILAYRLLQAKQTALALPMLQRVLELSPEEPQSWRDLGLAYAEDGQYQQAVDKLWEVVTHPWHGRFPDVELIALAELNAIVAKAGQQVDTSRMDKRLRRNLPLDMRAVLSWDADNTDIDLWVTDPNDEKVYYAHPLSYQGGKISRDFTGGYGPEEFALRTAKPGKYRVQAQFYGNRQQMVAGATTLMLRLSSGFGMPKQKDENIILRLSGQGSIVDVGTFEVK